MTKYDSPSTTHQAMIWFACKQCGKVHHRAESSAGAYVFCDCGQGLTVPWESTAEPQELPAAPAVPAHVPPQLEPVRLDEERVPSRRPPQIPLPAGRDWGDRPRGRPRWSPRRRDPGFCFNHEEIPSEKPCAACGEAFCGDCLVELQGKTLCGPCKNFRIRRLHTPPRVSGMAVSALLIAMLSGPLAWCVWLMAVALSAPVVNLLSLLPQILALLLGVWSMRDTETNPRISGRSLAITAVLTALVVGSVSILLIVFGARLGA